MTAIILFVSFFIFLALSVPIGISLGLATMVTLLYSETMSLNFIAQSLVTETDNFPLMAVPFFILAGELMGKGGITNRLFNLANVMVGGFTGGFAMAAIVTCMFFAAISGSGPATVAAIGAIMIPAMVDMGYDKKFATATVAAAGTIGVIIPPSIPMIVYGTSSLTSIGDMFIAGIIPGLFIGGILMLWAYIYSKKKGYKGREEKTTFQDFLKALWNAKWALVIPFIILGGIYGGIFTPTEAAVVAVVVALIVGLLLHRELKIKNLFGVFRDAALTTATILIIVGVAAAFGRLLTIEQIPVQVAVLITDLSTNPIVIILLITVLLLIVGAFMETVAAILIMTPILMPIVTELGMDPVHFGIVMVVNLAIGFITPPVGVNLFVGSGISGIPLLTLAKAILPYLIALIISLLIITFVPQLSLFLVSLMD
ncbi:TRAP transporter large permease [Salicibibacter cibi]|uniref:TRAP transporter large permease n=1 Tax=Salicibibacter cibi TaxID=2743001 RepID=A0A7T6Z8L3_9BACI|nr:TRAP transporter large permease [Salicibibacter cibi]QQK78831.1 TRAP transporter large permease [Salicibibacter cibi]